MIEPTLLSNRTQPGSGIGLSVRILDSDPYLSIRAEGHYTLENLYNLLDKTKEECEKRTRKVVVLDMTGIEGAVSNLDMHELAAHFGQVWNRAVRIVIVSPAGGVSKFFESVLWTRGIHIAVVGSQRAAAEWMRESV